MKKYQCVIKQKDVTLFLKVYDMVGGYIEFIPMQQSSEITVISDSLDFFNHLHFVELKYTMPPVSESPVKMTKAPIINIGSIADRIVINSEVDSQELREKVYGIICRTMTDAVNEVCKPDIPVDFFLKNEKELVRTEFPVCRKKELINRIRSMVNEFPDSSRFKFVLSGTVLFRSSFSSKE